MTTAASPDGVSLREAERADLFEVIRIEQASFPQPWPFDAFERFLGEPGFLVAEAGEGIVGYVVADVTPNYGDPIGHVKDFAVHPEWRSRGIGSRLLRRALAVLAAQGVASAKLEVRAENRGAIRLYRRFGFERHHTVPRYYDDGEDAIVLTADLAEY